MLQQDDSMGLAPWATVEHTEELGGFYETSGSFWEALEQVMMETLVTLYSGWFNRHKDSGDEEGVKH